MIPNNFFFFLQYLIFASTIYSITYAYDTDYTRTYVSIPEQYFNDPSSALNVKSNLQSKQYHDFIHTLYRYDKVKLQKVDQLFENAGTTTSSSSSSSTTNGGKSTTLSSNLLTPPLTIGAAGQHQRNKREIVFRPLFLYREQSAKREHIPESYPHHYQHKQHYEPVAQNQNYFYPDNTYNAI